MQEQAFQHNLTDEEDETRAEVNNNGYIDIFNEEGSITGMTLETACATVKVLSHAIIYVLHQQTVAVSDIPKILEELEKTTEAPRKILDRFASLSD